MAIKEMQDKFMNKYKNFIHYLKDKKYLQYFYFLVCLLISTIVISLYNIVIDMSFFQVKLITNEEARQNIHIRVFITKRNCKDCENIVSFFKELTQKYDYIDISYHDINAASDLNDMFLRFTDKFNISINNLKVPFVVFPNSYVVGSSKKAKKEIIKNINYYASNI